MKRYIDKEIIIKNLSNIESILDGSYIITKDRWSSKFIEGLNIAERKEKEHIEDKTKYISSLDDIDISKFKSITEALINIHKKENWIDILIAKNIINFEIPEQISGQYDKIKQLAIKNMIDYFDN